MPELIVILVVALVVLGPKRLPEVARQLGKVVSEFRRHSSDIVEDLQVQMSLDEARNRAGKKSDPETDDSDDDASDD